jgi:asparagine synthase (glutamine-hydrolysing)
MCGICGELRRGGGPVDRARVEAMTALLAHRGPDAQGYHEGGGGRLGLGQRRLSVIDLPGGRQPMSNEDGTVWIAFNGEIYNYRELRPALLARGHVFKTDSDTEAIIHQYEEDGPECVHKFIGMFAFAIWDERKRLLFIARDRLGIKPLYYTTAADRFLFASEVRPLLAGLGALPPLDPAALWAFLAIQYAPAPRTLFKDVRELEPGHRLLVDESGVRDETYWRLPAAGESEPLTGARAEAALVAMFDDAVEKRLVADVPLGAFLSGGIDSTAVVAAMRQFRGEGIKTFSVDFHAETGAGYVNETQWSALAARTFATDHYALTVSAADALAALPTVVARLDDLISDPAVIPTYLVSRFAREQVTVALSGEGGDELFAGYQRYALGGLARFYQPIPRVLRRLLFDAPAARLPHLRRVRKGLAAIGERNPAARHLAWLLIMPPDAIDAILGPGDGREAVEAVFAKTFAGQSGAFDLDRTLRADLTTWLPDDLLTKVDRASMAVGLECRVPFLDHRLVELALRIPAREKLRLLTTKAVFKRAMRGRVPPAIIARKKAGFTLPLDAWFRRELKAPLLDLLSPERLARDPLLNPAPIQALIREHLSGRENQGHPLFSLLILQMWREGMNRI